MGLAPGRLTAGALLVMAQFGFHDAEVALGKTLKAGITITLIETLLGFAPAGNTVNLPAEYEAHGFAQQGVYGNLLLADWQAILHGRTRLRSHLT